MKLSYLQLQGFNPLLRPDWRWQRVRYLLVHGRRPSHRLDDQVVWFYWGVLSRSRGDMGSLRTAREIYQAGGLPRDFLEARILARQSNWEIATGCGIPEMAVEIYRELFFDVAKRINASGWVHNQAIGRPRKPTDPSTLSMSLRRVGYFAGSEALEQLVEVIRKLGDTSDAADRPDLSSTEGKREVAIRRYLALETMVIDERAFLFICHLGLNIRARELAAHDPTMQIPEEPSDWLAAVDFRWDSGDLRCRVRDDWRPPTESAVA